MKKCDVCFKKVEIKGYNRFKKKYEICVNYVVNERDTLNFLKDYELRKAEEVIVDIVNSIKSVVKEEFKEEGEEVFSGYTLVEFKNLEDFEKKFIMFLKKFNEKVRDFIVDKSADGYINRFNSLSNWRCEV